MRRDSLATDDFFHVHRRAAGQHRASIPLETISLILRWQWRKSGVTTAGAGARASIFLMCISDCACWGERSSGGGYELFLGVLRLVGLALWPRRAGTQVIWAGSAGAGRWTDISAGRLGRGTHLPGGFQSAWLANWPRSGADPPQ